MGNGMRHARSAAWGWLLGMAGWSFALQAAEPPVDADFSYGGLQLEFAEPMRVWDNQVQRDVVRTTPALPLACHWDDDVLLLCAVTTPAAPRPATRYRIDLAPGLVTQQGKAIPAQVLHVETERPALSADVEGWDAGMPRFSITGNMAMTVADVQAVLRVRVGERDVPYSIERLPRGRYDGGVHRFQVRLPGEVLSLIHI